MARIRHVARNLTPIASLKTKRFEPHHLNTDRPDLHFMSGVREIRQTDDVHTQTDDVHTQWILEIAGQTREFDATITEQHPDERIAWKSDSPAWRTRSHHFHQVGCDVRLKMLVQIAAETHNAQAAWTALIDSDGENRDGAWAGEVTDLVPLDAWPTGTRVVLCKERPDPGPRAVRGSLKLPAPHGTRHTKFVSAETPLQTTDPNDSDGTAARSGDRFGHAA